MTKLKDQIKLVLDESRMLVLGAQILLGFAFRGVFESGFEKLPQLSQYLKLAALSLLLVTTGLLMAPGSYHRIVRGGSDARDLHDFATTVMDLALVPFLLALSVDVYLTIGRVLGAAGGAIVAGVTGALAIFFWYAFGFVSRRGRGKRPKERAGLPEAHPTKLADKIDQALTEARVVLPGVQALLGFQLVTMFMDGFEKLPNSSKYIHMASLVLMAATMILVMTPAAYHRVAERGEDTDRFHRVASNFLLAVMITLPLGLCGDVFIVFRKVTGSIPGSVTAALAVLIFFYALWFGFTAYRRAQLTKS
jgi:hypothetical protein